MLFGYGGGKKRDPYPTEELIGHLNPIPKMSKWYSVEVVVIPKFHTKTYKEQLHALGKKHKGSIWAADSGPFCIKRKCFTSLNLPFRFNKIRDAEKFVNVLIYPYFVTSVSIHGGDDLIAADVDKVCKIPELKKIHKLAKRKLKNFRLTYKNKNKK